MNSNLPKVVFTHFWMSQTNNVSFRCFLCSFFKTRNPPKKESMTQRKVQVNSKQSKLERRMTQPNIGWLIQKKNSATKNIPIQNYQRAGTKKKLKKYRTKIKRYFWHPTFKIENFLKFCLLSKWAPIASIKRNELEIRFQPIDRQQFSRSKKKVITLLFPLEKEFEKRREVRHRRRAGEKNNTGA